MQACTHTYTCCMNTSFLIVLRVYTLMGSKDAAVEGPGDTLRSLSSVVALSVCVLCEPSSLASPHGRPRAWPPGFGCCQASAPYCACVVLPVYL